MYMYKCLEGHITKLTGGKKITLQAKRSGKSKKNFDINMVT